MVRQSILPEKKKLYLAMLALQFCYAGFHIVSRTALNMGVSKVVFPVYRNIIALLLLAPFAYILEKITANQGFYLLGLYYASPTFASAIQNSVPAITFAMAAALRLLFHFNVHVRLEQVNIMRKDGLAKVLGTIASIGGATIITLYKGLPLFHHQSQQLLGDAVEGSTMFFSPKMGNWTLGCLYLLGNCFAWSGWIVLQGLVASGISFSLQIWCIDRGGPLFVAVFQPMQTVLVAIMASLILGDQLYSGGYVFCLLNFLLSFVHLGPINLIRNVDHMVLMWMGNVQKPPRK
ncbi:WAT1-related protein [Cinnamomum micranthum f. kanehirae]|uniref:WAT1-related protein n=1 Tax=Cinnamomum micranthum f. kanehirae TaxID=337451 RepID=A0A443PT43_9MAGN|nr:WAT1-related protein [Cinnamomum micranthum f. kanehirae]